MKVSSPKTRKHAQLAAWLLAAGSYAPVASADEATPAIVPGSTYAFLEEQAEPEEAAMAVSKAADEVEVEVGSESGTVGLAGVLPKKVIRIQLPFINYSGNEGFDEDGNKEKLGIDVNINASAFALQYGVTDKFTFGFGIPYIYKNKLSIDRANLRENNYGFKREAGRYLEAVAKVFLEEGQCPNLEACIEYSSDPGTTLPSNREITLTTGETVTANSIDATLVQIDNLLYRPIVPLDGETGIGDVQFGGAYSLVQADNYRASWGASIKLPTGAFEKVPRGRRAIGGGVTDLVTSLNVDYNPVPSVVLSASFQAEMMLASGTKYKNSGIFNDKINEADPSSEAAKAVGSDGKPNKQKFERAGVGRTYQARIGYSAKSLGGFLAPFGLSVSYQSNEDRETRYDGEAFDSSGLIFDFIKESTSLTTGISWSGLDNDPMLPITVSFDYSQFLSGKYMAVAPTGTNFTLSGFYKF